MKKITLLTKVMVPIIFFATIVSFIGFQYLNSLIQNIVNQEIKEKNISGIEKTVAYIESEFKLLFYLYGTSSTNYDKQESIVKKDVIDGLRKKSHRYDIVYISKFRKNIQISKNSISDDILKNILTNNIDKIQIKDRYYSIQTAYFKPWNWNIVYMLDITNLQFMLSKNKTILFLIVSFILLIVFIAIILSLQIFIKKPIKLLLEHFTKLSKGEYSHIENRYHTLEMDTLIDDVNKMTTIIKNREIELKKSEDYLNDILNSQQSIIIINDTEKILDVNKSFFKLLDQFTTLEEFQEKHSCICDYFVKEEGYIYKFEDKNWAEYILQNNHKLHKVKIKKNNEYFVYTIQAVRFEKYDRVIFTLVDITELEKSNNLLEQYKKAVDSSAIVSKSDEKGKITYVNDKFIDISGYSKDELIGANHNIVRSPNTSSEVFKDMWHTIKSKQVWHGYIENQKKDGTPYFVSATIVPILDENNDIYEYLALRYNITEQVIAKQEAQKAENAKGNFLANMSHEIRTPLNAIIGFTKLLINMKLEQKEAKYVTIIDQSAQNLLGIINDILDISKIENGSLVYEKIKFNPFKEFEGVIDLFMVNANEKMISLVSFVDPKIPQTIIGDPLRIKQVISNLISNAIKFTPKNGTIFSRIELVDKSQHLCKLRISIQDSGIGIPKDKQQLIFEEFSQADDSTSREFGGTGLGLSISNKIVKALGSQIQLESEIDKGSKFYFEIEFEIDPSTNNYLDEFKKLKVGILNYNDMPTLQYPILKEYLESLCSVTHIDNYLDIETIKKQDLIFVDESTINKDLMQMAQDNIKFIVLSHEKTICENLKNSIILNIPLNASVLFDILIEFIDYNGVLDEQSKTESALFNGSVLIAEDHEINQQLIAALLDIRGIKYTFANNGNEVVELFKKGKYDIVFMDIHMPEKNGLEATSDILEIEKSRGLKHTPIIALTANVVEAEKQKMLDTGVDDYLYKPIDEAKLDAIFNEYLEKNTSNTQDMDVSYNLDETSQNMGLNAKIVKTIVMNFCSTIHKDMLNLKSSIDEKNWDDINSYAHKIKGAALNLRMDKVAEFTKNIEDATITLDIQSINQNFKNLEYAIQAVEESIA